MPAYFPSIAGWLYAMMRCKGTKEDTPDMEIDYDELRRAAMKNRAVLAKKGILSPSGRKIRRKPRDPEKLAALRAVAEARLQKDAPYRDGDGSIILPWFSR